MIGKRLRELRAEKEISQKELSEKLDIVKSNISMYESDGRNPSPENLIKLSKFFNVTVDYLLGMSQNKNEKLKVDDGYIAVLSEAMEKGISADKLKKLIQFAKEFDEE